MIPLYRNYVAQETLERVGRGVSYRSGTFYANEAQLEAFRGQLLQMLSELAELPREKSQRRYFLSYILFPETSEAEEQTVTSDSEAGDSVDANEQGKGLV